MKMGHACTKALINTQEIMQKIAKFQKEMREQGVEVKGIITVELRRRT